MKWKQSLAYVWPIFSLMLLGGVMVEHQIYRVSPANTQAYHDTVRHQIESISYVHKNWLGKDVPVPPAAVKLLKANTIFSRQFVDLSDSRTASVLLVHCTDSRDILGHFPPVCYQTQGWTQEQKRSMILQGQSLTVPATQYRFRRASNQGDQYLNVINFMVLPDGRFAPDMGEVDRVSQDYRKKFRGASQVQIIVPDTLPRQEQKQIAEDFIDMLEPAILTIWSGGQPS